MYAEIRRSNTKPVLHFQVPFLSQFRSFRLTQTWYPQEMRSPS